MPRLDFSSIYIVPDLSLGSFGVGFPDNSEIVTTLVKATLNSTTSLTGQSLLNIYLAAMQRGAPLLAHLADAGKLQSANTITRAL